MIQRAMNIIWVGIQNLPMAISVAGSGETDFGIIKLKFPDLSTKDSTVCTVNGFAAAPDTLRDICGFDSAIVTFHPVTIQGPFDQIKKIGYRFLPDSISPFLPTRMAERLNGLSHPTLELHAMPESCCHTA